MNNVLIVFICFIKYAISVGNLGSSLNHCCDTGKTWSAEKKSCNITLSFPLLNVAIEHSTMCLNVVAACCLHSLRELRCNEGKEIGLLNEDCSAKPYDGKNHVDFMMCCEICKIGMTVGSTQTICQSTPLFYNDQWDKVYQSCCNKTNTKLEPLALRMYQNPYVIDRCIDGTHNCTQREKCLNTPDGFECVPMFRKSPKPIISENLILYKKKQSCAIGYAFDTYEQQCKDVDECAERPCDTSELCINTPGSFKCQCKNGFKLDSVMNACTDINECQLNLHTCQESQRCDNTIGSYQCVRMTGCGTGYTLDVESALCIDDDECALGIDTCSVLGPDWICKNTLGSFRCEKKRCTGPNCRVQGGSRNTLVNKSDVKCLRGYEVDSNNKCIDINECRTLNPCLLNELCINTNGSFYCLPKSKNFRSK